MFISRVSKVKLKKDKMKEKKMKKNEASTTGYEEILMLSENVKTPYVGLNCFISFHFDFRKL